MNSLQYTLIKEHVDQIEYFAKINENDIIDSRKFWQTVKPFLLDKVKPKEPIILVNNDNIMKLM